MYSTQETPKPALSTVLAYACLFIRIMSTVGYTLNIGIKHKTPKDPMSHEKGIQLRRDGIDTYAS